MCGGGGAAQRSWGLQALARVNEKGGDYDAAQRHFEMASEVSPRDLHIWQVGSGLLRKQHIAIMCRACSQVTRRRPE